MPLYSQDAFQVVVMGCGGGPIESNVSGYLIAPLNNDAYAALDAGTTLSGLFLAVEKNQVHVDTSDDQMEEAVIFREQIKAYLISHSHLDHLAGLVINSTVDVKKPLFGLNSTIDSIRDHLFNGKIWPNFGNEGANPLNLYQYMRIKTQAKTEIPDTSMSFEAFTLSHPNEILSTAFLMESAGDYALYMGDTAPDSLSKKKHLYEVWRRVAPLVKEKKLHGIFIECSYSDKQKPNQLYGHLEPTYLIQELRHLAFLVDPANPHNCLQNLKVFITHIKPNLRMGTSPKELIEQELANLNDLGVTFVFPVQGQKLTF
ncbi:MAG: 3',5'-cyclic-nucleotide phosphodiesterase [Candidatus Melainabacteria bacterium]|nr:3',5'-cyclic-nucleotide phosphodiesterase [Candidatus Melainabacteria bacterium]